MAAGIAAAWSASAGPLGAALAWTVDKLLAPALVAVLFAGTTTVIIERYRGRRDVVTKLADGLRDEMKALQELAISYWARDAKADDGVLEARIIAACNDLLQSTRILSEVIQLSDSAAELTNVMADLLDAVMGGSFQTAERKADAERVRAISHQIGALRSRVARSRIRNLEVLAVGAKRPKAKRSPKPSSPVTSPAHLPTTPSPTGDQTVPSSPTAPTIEDGQASD